MLHIFKRTMKTFFICKPRAPFIHRATYTCILQFASFAGKSEDIWYKHFWDAFLIVKYIGCTISPCHRRFDWCLGFTNYHWYSIDDIYQVKTLAAFLTLARELPLIGYYTAVLRRFVAEEADIDILSILSKRIGVFLKQQATEAVIGVNQLFMISANATCSTKSVNHLCCLVFSDGVKPPQCCDKPFCHQHFVRQSWNFLRLHINPTTLSCGIDEHLLNRIVFVKVCHFIRYYIKSLLYQKNEERKISIRQLLFYNSI